MPAQPSNPRDLEAFEYWLSESLDLQNMDVRTQRVSDFVRVSIFPKGRARKGEQPLILDLAPGPNTPFGEAIEWRAYSKWRGVFGPEIFAEGPDRMEIRSPITVLSRYIQASFNPTLSQNISWKPAERFGMVTAWGAEAGAGNVAGGIQWYGPVHPERGKYDYANRVTIGFGEQVKDQSEIWTAVYNRAALAAQKAQTQRTETEEMWANLVGYVPWKDDGGRARLRKVGTPVQTGETDWTVFGVGKNAVDILKRLNIAVGGGLREQATLYEVDPNNQEKIRQAQPKAITGMDWKGRAGYRYLNAIMPGETQRRAEVVQPHTFFTRGTPFSGAMITYQEALEGIFSGGYPGYQEFDIPQLSVQQLQNARFQFGFYREEVGEDGSPVYLPETDEKGMPKGLTGRFIEAGQSRIVGLMTYPTDKGEKVEPLRFTAEGRPYWFTGEPELRVPPSFSAGTGQGLPGEGIVSYINKEDRPQDVQVTSKTVLENIQRNFPGQVLPESRGEIHLQIPIASQVGISLKGSGGKIVQMSPSRPFGTGAYKPTVGLPGVFERVITGLTAELKNPAAGFMAEWSAMPTHKQAQMMLELGRENPALNPMAKELYRYVMEQGARTEERGGQTLPGAVSVEKLGEIYARGIGQPFVEEATSYQLFESLKGAVERLPLKTQIQRYEHGKFRESQTFPLGLVTESEKEYYTGELEKGVELWLNKQGEGLSLDTEAGRAYLESKYPGGLPKVVSDIFQFEPVQLQRDKPYQLPAFEKWVQEQGYSRDDISRMPFGSLESLATTYEGLQTGLPDLPQENMYLWKMKAPGFMGTMVSPAVPEFLSRSPITGYEEMASLNMFDPKLAEQLGLGLSQGPEATGFVPKHVSAWREVGQVSRYLASQSSPKLLPERRTEVSETLADEIIGKINSGVTDLDELEALFPDEGPLYNPRSGELLERPSTMKAISAFSFGEEHVLAPLSKEARRYPEALLDFLRNQTYRESNAMGVLRGARYQVFQSSTRGVPKILSGRFVPGTLGGRYSGVTGLGMLGATIGEERMTYALREKARAAGIDPYGIADQERNMTWMQVAREQIKNLGYFPGLFNRSPTQSREGGVQVMPVMTPEQVRRMGIHLPEGSRFSGGRAITGSTIATGFFANIGPTVSQVVGDWDADMAMMIMMGKASRLGLEFSDTDKLALTLARTDHAKRIAENLRLGQGGTSRVPGGAMDVVANALADLTGAVMGDLSGLGGEDVRFAGSAKWGDLYAEGINRIQSRGGMGVAYKLREMLESSATMLGFSDKAISQGGTGQGLFYQTYLDYMTKLIEERGGFRNLETIMQSAIFTESRSGSARLMFKPSAGVKHKTVWDTDELKELTGPQRTERLTSWMGRTLAEAVQEDFAEYPNTPLDAAAFMFATQSEDIPELLKQMQEKGIYRALFAPEGSEEKGYLEGRDITRTPVGQAVISSAAMGLFGGWQGKQQRVRIDEATGEEAPLLPKVSTQPIPFHGELMRISELGRAPGVRGTNMLYSLMTRKWAYPSAAGQVIRSAPLPEEMAFLEQQRLAMIEQGKEPPGLLKWATAQFGAASDLVAKQKAGERAVDEITPAQAAYYRPSEFFIGSSKLAYLGLEPGTIGMYTEDTQKKIAQQTRLQIVAEGAFGLEGNKLFPVSEEQRIAIERGEEFEREMAPKVAKALNLKHPLVGIPREKAYHAPVKEMEFLKDQPGMAESQSKVSIVPDLMGIDPESGMLMLGSFKYSSHGEEGAEEKQMAAGVKIQDAAYAMALRGLADKPVKFEKAVKPWLDEQPWYQKMTLPERKQVVRELRTAAQTGIQTRIFAGYTPEGSAEFKMIPPLGGAEGSEMQGAAFQYSPWAAPIAQAVRNYEALFTPENIAASVPAIRDQGALVGYNVGEVISNVNVPKPPVENVGRRGRVVTAQTQDVYPAGATQPLPPRPGSKGPFVPITEAEGWIPTPQSGGLDTKVLAQAVAEALKIASPNIAVSSYHYGQGRTPAEQMMRATIGITSAEGLMGNNQYELFAMRVREKLGRVAGIEPEELGRFSTQELAVTAYRRQPEETRQVLRTELPTMNVMARTYKAVYGGYQAIQTGLIPTTREQNETVAALLPTSLTEEDKQKLGVMHNRLAGRYGAMGESLATGAALLESAKDWGLFDRKKVAVTKDNLDEFMERIGAAAKAVSEFTDTIEDAGASEEAQIKAGRDLQRTILEKIKIPQRKEILADLGGEFEGLQQSLAAGEDVDPAVVQRLKDQIATESTGLAADQSKLARLEKQDTQGITTGQISRFTRRLIGGWGLFYLSHLASLPMAQWGYGYQANEEAMQAMYQTGQQQYGPGFGAYQSPELAQRRSQLLHGGPVMGMFRQMGANLPAPLRDISGAATAGLAAFAGLEFLAAAAPTGSALATGLAGAAPWVAPIIAGGALVATQAAYAQDKPKTMAATGIYAIQPDVLNQMAAGWRGMTLKQPEKDRAVELAYMGQLMQGGASLNAIRAGTEQYTLPLGLYYPTMSYGDTMRFAKPKGPIAPPTDEELKIMAQQAPYWEGMEGVEPTIAASAFLRLQGTPGEKDIVGVAQREMAGVPVQQLAAQTMAAYRLPFTREESGRLESLIQANVGTTWEQLRWEQGVGLAGQLSPGFRQAAGLTGSEDFVNNWLADFALGPNLDLLLTEQQQYSRFKDLGISYTPYIPSATQQYTPQQRAQMRAQELREEKAIDIQEQMQALELPFQGETELTPEGAALRQRGISYAQQALALGLDKNAAFNKALAAPQERELFERSLAGVQQADFLGLNRDQVMAFMQRGPLQSMLASQAMSLQQQAIPLGIGGVYEFASQGQYQANLANMGLGMANRVLNVTGSNALAGQVYDFATQNFGMANFAQNALSGNPITMTQMAQMGAPGMSMTYANSDIGLNGQVTGLGWGTTSMARGAMTGEQMANMTWGTRWQGTPWGEAAVSGITTPSGDKVGGMWGLQWYMTQRSAQYQQQMAGINLQQIDLQNKYQDQIWALQDQLRNLGYKQTEWGFTMQERQMGMQKSQFAENQAFSQRQSQMQRTWTQQDWGYQENVRNMQWGWKQEDFQENVRFMTGRERKLAERQMERETTMFGMEGEQQDRQKERQKELWRMEDQRFEMTKRHFNEQMKLQEENLKKQREFFEERKKLEEALTKLQRQQQKEQMELAKQAAEAQAAYAADMEEAQQAQMELAQQQQTFNGLLSVAQTAEVQMINTLVGGLNHIMKYASKEALAAISSGGGVIPPYSPPSGGGGGGGGGPRPGQPKMNAIGGSNAPNELFVVGDAGMELLKLNVPSSVIPNNETVAAAMGNGTFTDPWNDQSVSFAGVAASEGGSGPKEIVIYIGNERLERFIVDTFTRRLEVQ